MKVLSLVHALAAFAALAPLAAVFASGAEKQREPAHAALEAAGVDRVHKELRELVGKSEREPGEHAAVAQACLVLAAASDRFGASGHDYRHDLARVAKLLVQQKDLNEDGKVGWGVPADRKKHKKCSQEGMLDSFGDGSCNPVHTEYAFQTALSVMCLARAHELTGEQAFLEVATRAVEDWWNVGEHPKGCTECFYYWYSRDRNDFSRYVRNTNVLMASAVVQVWRLSGQADYRLRAEQVAKAELREIENGNFGYFGIDDPRYSADPAREARRVEDHAPWVSKGLLDIGRTLGNRAVVGTGELLQRHWQQHGQSAKCPKTDTPAGRGCDVSAFFSSCFFKRQGGEFGQRCIEAVRFRDRPHTLYELWAILE